MKIFKAILTLIVAVFSTSSYATPVLCTIDNLNFTDGGTASGSFVYDAGTNAVSSVSIVTTPGSLFAGTSYLAADSPAFDDTQTIFYPVLLPDLTGSSLLVFSYMSALSDFGGTIVIDVTSQFTNTEGVCQNALCTSVRRTRDFLAGGSVIGVPHIVPEIVPKPGTLALFGIGLSAMGLSRRRKKI